MIQTFNYDTLKAEINAMPCLPDVFRVIIPEPLMREQLEAIRLPRFDGYISEVCRQNSDRRYVLTFYKPKPEVKPKPEPSAQDLIIQRLQNRRSSL